MRNHKNISSCEERVATASLILEIDHIQVWRELILFAMYEVTELWEVTVVTPPDSPGIIRVV